MIKVIIQHLVMRDICFCRKSTVMYCAGVLSESALGRFPDATDSHAPRRLPSILVVAVMRVC